MEQPAESVVYTVGHANHPIGRFIELLRQHGIARLVDVRSSPYSAHHPAFNRPDLEQFMWRAHLGYWFLGDQLGGRPADTSLYFAGQVDYERLARVVEFRKGLKQIYGNASKYRLALMCAEGDPIRCHRALVVARQVQRMGLTVRHILPDGRCRDHRDLEQDILKAYRNSQSLFEVRPVHGGPEELDAAYRWQTGVFAYREDADEEAQ